MEVENTVNLVSWSVIEKAVSPHRLESYLADVDGNLELAIALYQWNIEMSAVLWKLISILEVSLRNAINVQLTLRSERRGLSSHWIFDEKGELGNRNSYSENKRPFRDVHTAIGRVRKNSKPVTAQQVISETSLGFWHQLVSSKRLNIWPDLAGAFPYAPSRDQKYVAELVRDLRKLRNRISHHHRLHTQTIRSSEAAIFELAKAIDPDLSNWLEGISTVNLLWERQPGPPARIDPR